MTLPEHHAARPHDVHEVVEDGLRLLEYVRQRSAVRDDRVEAVLSEPCTVTHVENETLVDPALATSLRHMALVQRELDLAHVGHRHPGSETREFDRKATRARTYLEDAQIGTDIVRQHSSVDREAHAITRRRDEIIPLSVGDCIEVTPHPHEDISPSMIYMLAGGAQPDTELFESRGSNADDGRHFGDDLDSFACGVVSEQDRWTPTAAHTGNGQTRDPCAEALGVG